MKEKIIILTKKKKSRDNFARNPIIILKSKFVFSLYKTTIAIYLHVRKNLFLKEHHNFFLNKKKHTSLFFTVSAIMQFKLLLL